MLTAVISDIHANLEALRAVLAELERRGVNKVLCLGDLVGYNADPEACVDEVLSRAELTVRGNHDKAVAFMQSLEWFNPAAREAVLWTRRQVAPQVLERLGALPEGPKAGADGILLCHGTPMDEDRYMIDAATIAESFQFLAERLPEVSVCFHGHTHVPLVARMAMGAKKPALLPRAAEVALEQGATYLINPGSVGQPRDGNPLASFGIFDSEERIYRAIRVPYHVAETQRKIAEAGLPAELGLRLAKGW